MIFDSYAIGYSFQKLIIDYEGEGKGLHDFLSLISFYHQGKLLVTAGVDLSLAGIVLGGGLALTSLSDMYIRCRGELGFEGQRTSKVIAIKILCY